MALRYQSLRPLTQLETLCLRFHDRDSHALPDHRKKDFYLDNLLADDDDDDKDKEAGNCIFP